MGSQASLLGSQWMLLPNQSYLAPRAMAYVFPRPRQGRVMKPRSAGNSPSSVSSRRAPTLPRGSMAQQQLPSQDYQTHLAITALASAARTQRARPLSWHPSSARDQRYFKRSYTMVQPHQPAPMYGEGNFLSYPPAVSDVPVSTQYPISNFLGDASVQQMSPLSMDSSQIQSLPWDTPSNGLPTTPQTMPPAWPSDMGSMDNFDDFISSAALPSSFYETVPSSDGYTVPSTPDLLPAQPLDIESESQPQPASNNRKSEDELVGMGLYSDPEASGANSLLGISGRGLKLEETFTPSSENEAEEPDSKDEDDDGEEENEEAEEPKQDLSEMTYMLPPKQTAKAPVSMLFGGHEDSIQSLIAESQQLLTLGEQSCFNYGYGWV